MWPVSLRGNLNTYVYPLILGIVVPSEGFKINIRSKVFGWGCEENGVTNIFEAQ